MSYCLGVSFRFLTCYLIFCVYYSYDIITLKCNLSFSHPNSRLSYKITNNINWEYFFCIIVTLSKLWCYLGAELITIGLTLFRLWMDRFDMCVCKILHLYNCTFMNHKWQPYFCFSIYFCHHMYVSNILCC